MNSPRLRLRDYLQVAALPALALAALIFSYQTFSPSGQSALKSPASAISVKAGDSSVEGFYVTNTKGDTVSLVPKEQSVLMLVSTTCGHCTSSVQALASAAGSSKPLPRLKVIVLQSPQEGQTWLAKTGLQAVAWGPAGTPRQLFDAFRTLGTPTLLWVDKSGRVLDRHVGAINGPSLDLWLSRAQG